STYGIAGSQPRSWLASKDYNRFDDFAVKAGTIRARVGYRRVSTGPLTNGVLVACRAFRYSPNQRPTARGRWRAGVADLTMQTANLSTTTAPTPIPPTVRPTARPIMPDKVEDLGISRAVVSDLILRYLWLRGSGTLSSLHQTLKLSFPVLETMFHQFRHQQLLEVKGMVGNDYSFSLTTAGRAQATARNEVCQYVGPAPVSIQDYHKIVKAQSAHVQLSREGLRDAFQDL